MVVQTMSTTPLSRFINDRTISTATTTAASASTFNPFRRREKPKPATLGILAFEAAKSMSRLLSLYRSLTEEELEDLRSRTLRSPGVTYLISSDESFLLNLAGLEHLEELEYVVASVSRLSRRCSDVELARFDLVYSDLKRGYIGIERSEFGSRKIEKIAEKIERLTSFTVNLYSAMETLSEMEVYEKKQWQWKKRTILTGNNNQMQTMNFELFESKIAFQRKQVKRYMELSLWNTSFDKCTAMMARMVCNIYTRIQTFFTPFASQISQQYDRLPKQLPLHFHLNPHKSIRIYPEIPFVPIPHRNSGPVIPISQQTENPSFYTRELNAKTLHVNGNNNASSRDKRRSARVVYNLASETTVGGAGLTMRYASVVAKAERMLEMMANAAGRVDEEARGELYEMLPDGLREMVMVKLRRIRRTSGNSGKEEEVEGWREGVKGIMGWLGEVARDTLRWQDERSVEKRGFEDDSSGSKRERRVVLAQTLHYADLEKTEAAIIEVLVGLSCMCRNRIRQPRTIPKEIIARRFDRQKLVC